MPEVLRDDLRKMLATPADSRNAVQKYLAGKFEKRLTVTVSALKKKNATFKALATTTDNRVKELQAEMPAEPRIRALWDRGEPSPTWLFRRGQYNKPGHRVGPGVPSVLTDGKTPFTPKPPWPGARSTGRRLELARWLVDPGHPLTARVAGNRLWQTCFGTGLVKTSGDFGSQGEPPSHPGLLDWPATEYLRTGWDTKGMIRLLVTSATYRQSSVVRQDQLDADPYNRLLGRGSRHRLPAHVIRDQALAVSGLMVEMIGGVSVKPYQPPGLWADFSFGKIKYSADSGAKLYRRSLYTFWRRSLGPPNMFDEGTRDVCHVSPQRTNTPLHALTLLNDETFAEAARVLGERLLGTPGDDASRMTRAFILVLSRPPTDPERTLLVSSLDRARRHYRAHPKQARAYATVGRHTSATGLDPVKVAAWGAVASLLLNCDEAITRE